MDEQSKQYFEAMEALSAQPGWKLLADDIRGFMEAIASSWQALTPESVRFEQGRYAGLQQIADHFGAMENLKASILSNDEQEAA